MLEVVLVELIVVIRIMEVDLVEQLD